MNIEKIVQRDKVSYRVSWLGQNATQVGEPTYQLYMSDTEDFPIIEIYYQWKETKDEVITFDLPRGHLKKYFKIVARSIYDNTPVPSAEQVLPADDAEADATTATVEYVNSAIEAHNLSVAAHPSILSMFSGYYTREETDQAIQTIVGDLSVGFLKNKGSVATKSALPTTASDGDMYSVLDIGEEYYYINGVWNQLDFTIDLSPYSTTLEVQADIAAYFTSHIVGYATQAWVNAQQYTPLSVATALNSAINAVATSLQGKEPIISAGTGTSYYAQDKTWKDFATTVRGSVLTGYTIGTNTVIGATDTVFSSFQKLQGQINARPIIKQRILIYDTGLYLNASTGNDSNDGLTSGTALKTMQAVSNWISRTDLGGCVVTLYIYAGSYTGFRMCQVGYGSRASMFVNGTGNMNVNLQGNVIFEDLLIQSSVVQFVLNTYTLTITGNFVAELSRVNMSSSSDAANLYTGNMYCRNGARLEFGGMIGVIQINGTLDVGYGSYMYHMAKSITVSGVISIYNASTMTTSIKPAGQGLITCSYINITKASTFTYNSLTTVSTNRSYVYQGSDCTALNADSVTTCAESLQADMFGRLALRGRTVVAKQLAIGNHSHAVIDGSLQCETFTVFLDSACYVNLTTWTFVQTSATAPAFRISVYDAGFLQGTTTGALDFGTHAATDAVVVVVRHGRIPYLRPASMTARTITGMKWKVLSLSIGDPVFFTASVPGTVAGTLGSGAVLA